jgi:hypothetical protein
MVGGSGARCEVSGGIKLSFQNMFLSELMEVKNVHVIVVTQNFLLLRTSYELILSRGLKTNSLDYIEDED